MAELAGLISRDAMLAARILQTANSSAYSSGGTAVTTVSDAIRKVGCNSVRNIAAALGVFDCMPEAGTDGFNPIRYWQHSFAVAQTCERLASVAIPDQSGLAYLVGLCHDLADMFIRMEFGKEYSQVLTTAASTGSPKELLHVKMLGMTPAQMTNAVLRRIGLPDAIREPIEILHSPNAGATHDPLAKILWMAENYANAILLASGHLLDGWGPHRIARELNDLGIPSPTGENWGMYSVESVLNNSTYTGVGVSDRYTSGIYHTRGPDKAPAAVQMGYSSTRSIGRHETCSITSNSNGWKVPTVCPSFPSVSRPRIRRPGV